MSLNYPLPNLVYWLHIMHKTSSLSLLLSVTRIGLTSIAWLCLNQLAATPEALPHTRLQTVVPSNAGRELLPLYHRSLIPSVGSFKQNVTKLQDLAQNPTAGMLFVNPSSANGSRVDGSVNAPFKTITAALQVAEPNSVIILHSGTYSTDSGETFPLQLKSGVTIQGDSKTKGSNITIKGGGTYISPTFARQNVAILAANKATLTGVSVTNPNPRGYGLWIESSAMTVSDNTFTGSVHDGISVTGNSAAIIRNNYFYQNGANGITIYGNSKPEVRENVFEHTGFGINIAQTAAPLLVGNRIINNRSGVVIQAHAQPVLRNNVISGNTEDGLVAIASSMPDLGTSSQPGGNIFRQNGRYDINNSTKSQLISAFGNQLAQDHSVGNIDLAGTGNTNIIVARNNNSTFASVGTVEKKEQYSGAGGTPAQTSTRQAIPPQAVESKDNGAGISPTPAPIEIPVPPPVSTLEPKPSNTPQKFRKVEINQPLSAQSNVPPAASNNVQPTEIKIPTPASENVPPPPPTNGSLTQGLPVLVPAPINTSVLSVPNSKIPIGNNSNQLKPQVLTESRVSKASPPQIATTGFRYRVVVLAENESVQAKVRSLVPGAFPTVSNGKAIVQAGIFGDRAKAEEILQLLTDNGLKAAIEPLN